MDLDLQLLALPIAPPTGSLNADKLSEVEAGLQPASGKVSIVSQARVGQVTWYNVTVNAPPGTYALRALADNSVVAELLRDVQASIQFDRHAYACTCAHVVA